jgi:putative endonuclease
MGDGVEGALLPDMPRDRKTYCTYIMGSLSGTLYIGMTGNLHKRVFEHKFHRVEGFTDKYEVERLLYRESFDDVHKAIAREKQLKGWRRSKKIALIEAVNPHWMDLAREWFPWMTDSGVKGALPILQAQCHPERSNCVREANAIAESKDPYSEDAAGNPHSDGGTRMRRNAIH